MVQPVPGRAGDQGPFLDRMLQIARERREEREAEEARRRQEQQQTPNARAAGAAEEAPNPNRAGTREAERRDDQNPPPSRNGIPRNDAENGIDLFA